ncbi:MAG: peptidyl-prolyl cis-trans isomerase [Planctomycetes bacterium]|nr:peptidyl-prolyl cis-trans isomerase [Planctomycetota bacterium]
MRVRLLALAAVLGLAGLVACRAESGPALASAATETATFDVEKKRDWAARLRAEGLDEQALRVYEELLADGRGLSPQAFTGASLIVARIHMEHRRYEEALASLMRATAFGPEGDTGAEIDRLRIQCLERLGRGAAADRLLARTTTLDPGAESKDDPVLARVGDESIRRSEFESLLAEQPAEMAQRLAEPSLRRELLRSLVAQRVMERKALKLGLEDDPKVRLATDLARREILVRKLVADEVREQVEVAPDDVRLYYQAHPERFREPSRFQLAQILADDLDHEQRIRAALATESFETVAARESRDPKTAQNGGRIEGEVVIGQSHPIFGDTRRLAAILEGTAVGAVAPDALKTAKGRHVLEVLKREDGAPIPFDQVKDQAERMLRAEREQLHLQEMTRKALEDAEVEIFEDRLDG